MGYRIEKTFRGCFFRNQYITMHVLQRKDLFVNILEIWKKCFLVTGSRKWIIKRVGARLQRVNKCIFLDWSFHGQK